MDATVDVVDLTVMPGYRPIARFYINSRSPAVPAAPEKHPQPGSSKLLQFRNRRANVKNLDI
ncbi:hypothetical protein QUB68_16320 [Microcoleus sp. A006_D1]|uniref:hypothetical protein n=1 Tax=Microcoleus sp. A006_D1 TaxID=3055267 RepID=UPI002FD16B44